MAFQANTINMTFEKILGQDHIKKRFTKIISEDYLAHAYIFLGIDGVGKALFSKQLAKYLNCKTNNSCDKCPNCHKIETETSPDVHWISVDKEKKLLGIDKIKTIQHDSILKPVESNKKIFIIKDSEKLTEEASNCILKILEEPPPSTLIILLVNTLDSIPETVISRCHIIRFSKLSEDIILNILSENYENKEEDVLKWAAQVSNGSVSAAITVLEEDLFDRNEFLINALSNLCIAKNFDLSKVIIDWVSDKSKTLEPKRTYLKLILTLMLNFYRDLLISNTQSNDQPFYFNKRVNHLKFNSYVQSVEAIINTIDKILIAYNNLESNANINLLIENLITSIASLWSKTINERVV